MSMAKDKLQANIQSLREKIVLKANNILASQYFLNSI